jgi:hypothetical protein
MARRTRLALAVAAAAALAMTGGGLAAPSMHVAAARAAAAAPVVWLCRPGLGSDPCRANLTTTVITGSGALSTIAGRVAPASRFDCFYVYPTVSRETSANADLRVQKSEVAVATAQASRFSQVCRVYAPVYRQVTLPELVAFPRLNVPAGVGRVAYTSLLAGFDAYLKQDNDGRPIVFIGHSQGAAILIELLARVIDNDPGLRRRLVLAIVLGGDVEVPSGKLSGGSFAHIPLCSKPRQDGCVIAYSSFPHEPPAASLFGRPGQGVALQSGQTGGGGLAVACVNPASLSGGAAVLDSFFPSLGALPTPWVEFPGLYTAHCETAGGATWLQVTKATGAADKRPLVSESDGPDWGYHTVDVNLALGNLVADVAAAEASWSATHPIR